MNLQENLMMSGKLTISEFDRDGNLKEAKHVPNLVVTAGKNYIAARMAGTSGVGATVMNTMAIGSGTGTPDAAQTALGTELVRVATTTFTASTNTVTATATFPAGSGTGAVTEAGIFNPTTPAGTNGTNSMLCRTTFPVVNKAAGDSIAITWTITVS
jgi:hypothetical protein